MPVTCTAVTGVTTGRETEHAAPGRPPRRALILVAEKRGPTMLPRNGVLRFRPQRSALEEAEAEAGRMKVKRNDPSAGAS